MKTAQNVLKAGLGHHLHHELMTVLGVPGHHSARHFPDSEEENDSEVSSQLYSRQRLPISAVGGSSVFVGLKDKRIQQLRSEKEVQEVTCLLTFWRDPNSFNATASE